MSDAESAITALIALMARLRDPQRGCPWDQKQTFATVAPYTIEEAYEVADAIEKGDPTQLRDELGDLLFQVVFHAQMAQERGWFDFAQVASAIHEKLVRRHPHVFGGQGVGGDAEVSRNWEEQKARERAAAGAASGLGGGVSALADVPRGLPALVRAAKLGKRAGRVGFDWVDAAQVRDKVLEELGEVDGAIADGSRVAGGAGGDNADAGVGARGGAAPAVVEEMGDLLFALSNWSRHLKFDAEEALRAANSKFERRFRDMETLAVARGLSLENLSPQQWESLWEESKARERRGAGDA
jgi:nucleoside triphosphate diphosphatase